MRPITERLSRVIRALVVTNALVFAFYIFVRQSQGFIKEHLALGPGALAGELWQPVTSLFVHIDPINLFFNLLGLWFAGASIERSLGTRRFLILFLGAGVAANLAMVVTSAWLANPELSAGCGNSILAIFVAFGVIYNRTQARVFGSLVMEARWLTAVLIGFVILVDVSRAAWSNLAGDLVAIVLGFLLGGGQVQSLRTLWSSFRAKRQRRRYQILEGGRSGGGPRSPYLN